MQFGAGAQSLFLSAFTSNNTFGGAAKLVKEVRPTVYTNTNAFGADTLTKSYKYSYANTAGTGNRTGSITVTTTATLGGSSGPISNAVDGTRGSTATHGWWWTGGQSGRELKFDFGTARIVRQSRWYQDNSGTSHGTWKWQGSNDNSNWTDIGNTFTLGTNFGQLQIHTELINNTTAYRYYRLLQTAGTTDGGPWQQEIEFFLDGPTQDEADTSYYYPAGGLSFALGGPSAASPSGDRTSLITVTGTYTQQTAGAQTLQNLVDGGLNNNVTDSIDWASSQPPVEIKFKFTNKQHIDAWTVNQSGAQQQGLYTLEGSNDNINWTQMATGKDLTGSGTFTEVTVTNTTAYFYYRFTKTGGTFNTTPWTREIFFKTSPTVY